MVIYLLRNKEGPLCGRERYFAFFHFVMEEQRQLEEQPDSVGPPPSCKSILLYYCADKASHEFWATGPQQPVAHDP